MRIFNQFFTDNFESFDWLTPDSDILSPERAVGTLQRSNNDHADFSEARSGGIRWASRRDR